MSEQELRFLGLPPLRILASDSAEADEIRRRLNLPEYANQASSPQEESPSCPQRNIIGRDNSSVEWDGSSYVHGTKCPDRTATMAYIGADSETVDVGSAAHGPPEGIGIAEQQVRLGHAAWMKIYNEGGIDHRLQAAKPEPTAEQACHDVRLRGANECTQIVLKHAKGLLAESLEAHAHLTAQTEQIGRLICERDQLRREVAMVRGLLSRLPEDDCPAVNPVQADIDRTIDHLANHRTTSEQRRDLTKAAERADRVRPGDDAAVGRALR